MSMIPEINLNFNLILFGGMIISYRNQEHLMKILKLNISYNQKSPQQQTLYKKNRRGAKQALRLN